MTATERMRALLDERGVGHGGDRSVVYFEDSRGYKAMAYEAPRRYGDGVLCVHHTATPEQAVEATLGPAVPPPEPPVVPYDLLIDELRDTWGIEACWDGLRKFWYLGWTDEHVEDMGRLHDELCDAVAEASTVKAHRILDKARYAGRGTCKVVSKPCDMWECECGKAWWHGGAPNYCPSCGRRVES